MNKILQSFFIFHFSFFISCVGTDPADFEVEVPEAPVLSEATVEDRKIKEIFEKYGIWIRYDFPEEDYTYDWSKNSRTEYTPVKREEIGEALDSIQKWILDFFPDDFIREYAPLQVLLVDSCFTDSSILTGDIAINYLAFGQTGSLFQEADKREIRSSWVSLFIEKMMSRLPYPKEFAKISQEGYAEFIFNTETDLVKEYAILKPGRYGELFSGFLSTTSFAQDFGDFVAFILYKNEVEKQSYYIRNPLIEQKVRLTEEYFLTHWNFALQKK